MINVHPRNGDFCTVPAWLRRQLPLATLIALLLAGTAARAADDDEPDREALLRQRHEELMRKWEAQFRDADTDHDGKLSRSEMQAAKMPDSLIRHFDEIDIDRDGELSPQEMIAAYEKRLARQHPLMRTHAVPDTP